MSVSACTHCGNDQVAAYCAACGQRVRPGRLALRSSVGHAVSEFLGVERGLLRTAIDLTLRPGRVAGEYLAGRTRPYMNPIRYFLLMVTLAQLVVIAFGVVEQFARGAISARGEGDAESVASSIGEYWVVFGALMVPIFAFFARALFRGGRNYAEHLALQFFFIGHAALILSLAFSVESFGTTATDALAIVLLAGAPLWHAYATVVAAARKWPTGVIAWLACVVLTFLAAVALASVPMPI